MRLKTEIDRGIIIERGGSIGGNKLFKFEMVSFNKKWQLCFKVKKSHEFIKFSERLFQLVKGCKRTHTNSARQGGIVCQSRTHFFLLGFG